MNTWRAGERAAPPRTLVEVFAETVRRHPEAMAIDDGDEVLSYEALAAAVQVRAELLAAAGVQPGDRVGVRAASGTVGLYVSVLAALHVGAAYVPVDADDPDLRASQVFSSAGVRVVLGDGPEPLLPDGTTAPRVAEPEVVGPEPHDGAWVIFTSGSTGTPKGVAVSHRSAAAFVDAEASMFLATAAGGPLGPGDRVLAGLSVAFDASCEEMWLAWRSGATLVPAPRALVRAGDQLAGWLVDREITAVSTVPTLAGLWDPASLEGVRLLIFGGEAVPAELVRRLHRPGLEMWNTYGPTETTVVACAARLDPAQPVRIGFPLDGWDLAVVDGAGVEVGDGQVGELVVGGVGLARYLDATLDAERFAPAPRLGWERAYRTGDLVRRTPAGLEFVGRADDQVKVNGHRIELGEVDAALLELPGVEAAAAAVRHSAAGAAVLVGYVVSSGGVDRADLAARLRSRLPGSMVPVLAQVDSLPTRTSGKVDRDALPWPPSDEEPEEVEGTAGWVAQQWAAVIGMRPHDLDDDFFAVGGGSLTAAQLVSALRARFPEVTVAEVYDNPTVGGLAAHLDRRWPQEERVAAGPVRVPAPMPRAAQAVQLAVLVVVRGLAGLRWLTVLGAIDLALGVAGVAWAPDVDWRWVLAGWLITVSPPGRLGVSTLAARVLRAGLEPGTYPRGGSAHLRLWTAEKVVDGFGAITPATAPWVGLYARALGVRMGRDVDLHAVPPVTGWLVLGDRCAIEPEVDLSGIWVDGDVVHVGEITVGRGATVGARSVLLPGAVIGDGTDVAAGAAVHGRTGEGEYWVGSPARRAHEARHPWPSRRPEVGAAAHAWSAMLAVAGVGVALVPVVAVGLSLLVLLPAVRTADLRAAVAPLLALGPAATLVALALEALLVLVGVRLLSIRLTEGHHPVRSRIGVQAWTTQRLTDAARTALFPLYSSVATPAWLRALGAKVGRGTEISTVVGLPTMMRVKDGAFLADDTMVAPYELGGGWLLVARATVGRRAFVGNSGMTAPGRTVPKNGLIAVLSATPSSTRSGRSYLGSPPQVLPRAPRLSDPERTYEPPARLRRARAAVEVARVLAPLVTGQLALVVLLTLQWLVVRHGWVAAAVLAGPVLLAAGLVAGTVTVAAKWLLVGRHRAGEHPLWSSTVWRGELADTFTEVLAAPFALDPAAGSVALVWWLRAMGARVGRGVWCQTYWLPEPDLVSLGPGSSVGPGCVVQTHLFHDRVMSLGPVTFDAGATLGPHGVVLPEAGLGAGACVGPASLVLRGEAVPAGSRWAGNPIAPWTATAAR